MSSSTLFLYQGILRDLHHIFETLYCSVLLHNTFPHLTAGRGLHLQVIQVVIDWEIHIIIGFLLENCFSHTNCKKHVNRISTCAWQQRVFL